MLYSVMLIIQILVALGIIGLVLVQHGKGADAGAAFGGGASGTVFGSKGSGSFLTRLTAILAAIFFANSLFLAWLVAHPSNTNGQSIIPAAVTESVPTSTTEAPATSIEATEPAVEKKPQSDIPK